MWYVLRFEHAHGLKRYNDRRLTRGQTTCSLGGTASLGLAVLERKVKYDFLRFWQGSWQAGKTNETFLPSENQCFIKLKSQKTRYLETFQPVNRLMYSVPSELYSSLQSGFLVERPHQVPLYVNNLPYSVLASHVAMFADDIKLYKQIKSHEDTAYLQADLLAG